MHTSICKLATLAKGGGGNLRQTKMLVPAYSMYSIIK